MTIKPCAVALLGLLLLACNGDGSNHESGHELNPQPGSYVCNTPGTQTYRRNTTPESRFASMSPDGMNRMGVLTFDGAITGTGVTNDEGGTNPAGEACQSVGRADRTTPP